MGFFSFKRLFLAFCFVFFALPGACSQPPLVLGLGGQLYKDPVVSRVFVEADSVLVATSTGLFFVSMNGSLQRFVATSGPVVDFAVLDDVYGSSAREVAVAVLDQTFSNVRVFDPDTGDLVWDFEPTVESYDPSLMWTMKQTRTWDLELVEDATGDRKKDLLVASGSKVFLLDGLSGKVFWNFSARNDVWGLGRIEDYSGDGVDDVVAGGQDGYLYVVDAFSGTLVWEKQVCLNYSIVNPQTNQSMGEVTRNVWDFFALGDISGDGKQDIAVSCEDGNVYLLGGNNGFVVWNYTVLDYSPASLYMTYSGSKAPTGFGSPNFFNLRILPVDDVSGDGEKDVVAYSYPGSSSSSVVSKFVVLASESGGPLWEKSGSQLKYTKEIYSMKKDGETELVFPAGVSGLNAEFYVFSARNGSRKQNILANYSLSRFGSNNFFYMYFVDDERFLLASNMGDLLLVNSTGANGSTVVEWCFPRLGQLETRLVDLVGDEEVDVFAYTLDTRDVNGFFNPGAESRQMFVVDGSTFETAWSYLYPYGEYVASGGLKALQLVDDADGDGKRDVLAYSQEKGDENWGDRFGNRTRVLLFSGATGEILFNVSPTNDVLYGDIEVFFENKSLVEKVSALDFDGLLQVPPEYWPPPNLSEIPEEQRSEELLDWISLYDSLPVKNRTILEFYRSIDFENFDRYVVSKRVESVLKIGDVDRDGVGDILVSGWRDLFVLSGKNGSVLLTRTGEPGRYGSMFNWSAGNGLYWPWLGYGRLKILGLGDVNSDGYEDILAVRWDNLTAFYGTRTPAGELNYTVAWDSELKNINRDRVLVVPDATGDGKNDVLMSSCDEQGCEFLVFDGKTGEKSFGIPDQGTIPFFSLADFDSGGKNDTLVYQKWGDEGGRLYLRNAESGYTTWDYGGIRDSWQLEQKGFLFPFPAARVTDFDGDGVEDLALVRTKPWDRGAEILLYDVSENKQLEKIVLEEESEWSRGDENWQPAVKVAELSDSTGDGRPELGLIASFYESQYSSPVRFMSVDLSSGRTLQDFTVEAVDFFPLSEKLVVVTLDSFLYLLDDGFGLSIVSPKQGEEVNTLNLEFSVSDPSAKKYVYVDGVLVLKPEEDSAVFDVGEGERRITVVAEDFFGKRVYDSVQVEVKRYSSIGDINTFLVFLLIVWGIFSAYRFSRGS